MQDDTLQEVERRLGRRLTEHEVALVRDIAADKTPELIARELEAAPITDPKKIRPEHKDVADE